MERATADVVIRKKLMSYTDNSINPVFTKGVTRISQLP